MANKKIDEFDADQRVDLKLLENGTYYLSGEIEEEIVYDVVKWILYENLTSPREDKTLTLYINSTGGDLYQAFALIDVMQASNHKIRTIGIGAVMSAAFLIFAAGTKGERYAAKNCSFMCHQYTETISGKHHDLKATMKEGESYNQKMIQLLRDATGLPQSRVRSKLLPASDVYLSAEEVVDLGVADRII